MNFSKAGMNFSNSCVFRVRHHEPHFRSLNVLMRSMCRRKSACVVAKGEGQQGVQSEWVGTTWFRRLVQKDSCFELGKFRYVLESPQKCSCVDTGRNQKKVIGTVSVRVFDACATKLHISHEPCVSRHRFSMTTKSPTLNITHTHTCTMRGLHLHESS